jgi:hypothetical protein
MHEKEADRELKLSSRTVAEEEGEAECQTTRKSRQETVKNVVERR